MPKRPSAYYRPKQLDKALQQLSQPDTVPLAGGTLLLAGDITSAVVDLQDIGLDTLQWRPETLEVGAMVRLTDLSAFLDPKGLDSVRAVGPVWLLRNGIYRAGPNTIRNAATLGGTVASRWVDSELLAALLVLDTALSLRSPNEQVMSLVDYLAAAERPSGLITSISIPWMAGEGRSERVARTPADYPIVSITMWQANGEPPRLAATGVTERPVRLRAAETHLAGETDAGAVAVAAAAARAAADHPGDFRGDAAYRAEMAAVLTRRVLTD